MITLRHYTRISGQFLGWSFFCVVCVFTSTIIITSLFSFKFCLHCKNKNIFFDCQVKIYFFLKKACETLPHYVTIAHILTNNDCSFTTHISHRIGCGQYWTRTNENTFVVLTDITILKFLQVSKQCS